MILCICTLICQYESTQNDAPNMASRDAKTILTPTLGYRKYCSGNIWEIYIWVGWLASDLG